MIGEVHLLPFNDYRFILTPAVVTDPAIYLSVSAEGTPNISPMLAEYATLDTSSAVPVLRFEALPGTSLAAPLGAKTLLAVAVPDRSLTLLALDTAGTIFYASQYDPFFNSYWSVFRPFGGRADALAYCQLIDGYQDYVVTSSEITVVWKVDGGRLPHAGWVATTTSGACGRPRRRPRAQHRSATSRSLRRRVRRRAWSS